jgi:hypothetical protein
MKTFSHIGIPTSVKRDGETYMEGAKLFVTDFNTSDNKIEWLRFEDDSPMPEQLQSTAHVAFKVDDLEAAMQGQEVLMEPFEPADGIKIAFILEDGAPVELMQEI